MRRGFTLILILACFGALFLICYAPALFRDRQFGFRDAANYYYPLNERVQNEWNHGRWPLWEPEENAGVPLLGNPTAAVLYPGKLVFAILPYPWAARIYIVAHSALAFLTMLVLMRSLGTSGLGSAMSGLAYAFGAPILFQYCNIIYLIGAAWLPLGIHAADRWVRLGRRWGLCELAIVLSMQVLGGEPQAAYLLGLVSLGYASGLAWVRARSSAGGPAGAKPRPPRFWLSVALVTIALAVWFLVTLALAQWLPGMRESGKPPPPLRWMVWAPLGGTAAWGLVAAGFLLHWRGRGWRFPLGAMWLGLAGSAALAFALSAAQLLPVIEFTQQTSRAAAGAGLHEIYLFSLEPFRPLGIAWPNFMGLQFEGNTFWGSLLKIPGVHRKEWVPSLYLGGLTFALALSALTFRHGPPWRVWFSVITVVSLLASLGPYTSPIWMARAVAQSSPTVQAWIPDLGPTDPADTTPIRMDGYLRDGDGGLYWWLATALPGFRQFRFPAKLFTFTALGMAILAGLGWDRVAAGRGRRVVAVSGTLLVLTSGALAGVLSQREPILASFRDLNIPSTSGPFSATAGYAAIVGSLGQATIVFGLGLLLTLLARRRPRLAGSAALIVMTADLAAANARLIFAVPQAALETKPEVLKIIETAERARPSSGPYRIHRVPTWSPMVWRKTPSTNRLFEFVSWSHDTLDPKYGINLGIEYTQTVGAAELDDFDWYFKGFHWRIYDPQVALTHGIELGDEVVYYPRRAYDMWNTRYFILPADSGDWRDPMRGTASFLFQSERVYPEQQRFIGPHGAEEWKKWTESSDFIVQRNLRVFPRSWVVHDVRGTVPHARLTRETRRSVMREILYAADPIWKDATQLSYDPHSVAWVSRDDLRELSPVLSGEKPISSETVKVTYPNPQQAVLEATLDSPGLVILADVYYPGWELLIDGKPAPIYRANVMMRGAAVSSGRHRLVYTYRPQSFRVGLLVSIAGLAALLILGVGCARWPVDPVLGRHGQSG